MVEFLAHGRPLPWQRLVERDYHGPPATQGGDRTAETAIGAPRAGTARMSGALALAQAPPCLDRARRLRARGVPDLPRAAPLQPRRDPRVAAALSRSAIWRSGATFTAASFLCLTGSDTLAVRYTGRDLPYRKIALASFTSLSIGHTLGFAAFSSGAVRYRFYAGWGLSAGDVGRIIVFCGLTVGLGLATLGGIARLLGPRLIAELFGAAPARHDRPRRLLLLAVVLYLGLAAFVHRPIRIRHFELPVPPLRLALGQIAVRHARLLLVSAVLHQMLTASATIGFFPVAMATSRPTPRRSSRTCRAGSA